MNPEPDGHVNEDELERYALGECSEEDCARLEEHLLICAGCRTRMAEMDGYMDSMRRAAAEWRATHPRKKASGK